MRTNFGICFFSMLSELSRIRDNSDNGSEFINDHLFSFCRDEKITFTRSRPYRKNDTCYVEQKNWSVVRRAVGYRRYDTQRELQLLNQLYSCLRILVNFFYPSMKLISKSREGAKVKKRYGTPKTPYQRVLEDPHVQPQVKTRLRAQMAGFNPVELKREVVRAQQRLEVVNMAKMALRLHDSTPASRAPRAKAGGNAQ
jgi:hypothetical protein